MRRCNQGWPLIIALWARCSADGRVYKTEAVTIAKLLADHVASSEVEVARSTYLVIDEASRLICSVRRKLVGHPALCDSDNLRG